MRHTPGPWRIEAHPDERGIGLYADAWGFLGFLDSGTPDQANARRIVACVNACEGLANPEEYIRPFRAGALEVEIERDQLREKNKELMLIIQTALEYISSEAIGTAQEEIEENTRIREILRTTLANAK